MSKENYEWLNLIPIGWTQIAKQMIEECEAINPTYTVEDMKEKFGELRIYSHIRDYNDSNWAIPAHNDEEIDAIENRYIVKSARTCCQCGKPATKVSTGWILPFCDKCGIKPEKYYKRFK